MDIKKALVCVVAVPIIGICVGLYLGSVIKPPSAPVIAAEEVQPGYVFIGKMDIGFSEKILQQLEINRDYYIQIETTGGPAWECVSIISRLRELKMLGYTIITSTYGQAMSAGCFIFLTGDHRIAHKYAVFMTHATGVQTYTGRVNQKSEGLIDWQTQSFKVTDTTWTDLLRNVGISDDMIEKLLFSADSYFFDAEEALRLNIATEIR